MTKIQCYVCKGSGVETDENGIEMDEPCSECAGTGVTYEDDALLLGIWDGKQSGGGTFARGE